MKMRDLGIGVPAFVVGGLIGMISIRWGHLSSTAEAAWIQAIGTILAIGGAVFVAVLQSSNQHKNAIRRYEVMRRRERQELSRTLVAIGSRCAISMQRMTEAASNREIAGRMAEGVEEFDPGSLRRMEIAVQAIKLHELPEALVQPTLMLGGTIHAFLATLDKLLRDWDEIEERDDLEEYFDVMQDMAKMVLKICGVMQTVITSADNEEAK